VLLALGFLGVLAVGRLGGPRLDAVVPEEARIGETVVLEGSGFGPALEDNVVYFGDTPARVVGTAPDELVVDVPDLELGAEGRRLVTVMVQVGTRESARIPVHVLAAAQPEPATGDAGTEEEEED
jgi:hypothetical protein